MTVELIRLSLGVFGFQFVIFWLVDFTPWPVTHSRTPLFVLQRRMVSAGCIMIAIPAPNVDQTPTPACVFDGCYLAFAAMLTLGLSYLTVVAARLAI